VAGASARPRADLVSLRDLNEQIEDLRLDLRNPPLSEFTPYLGGTSEKPGMISGQWVERYFDEALAEDIVTEEELAAA
jgi:hypothetical protein